MRKINYPLLLGGIIVLFFTFMAFFPQLFTHKDPIFEEPPKVIEYWEGGEWVQGFGQNPIRPNRENLMGTDDAGRDVYARLVYGANNTLRLALTIALFRMALALPLGLLAGMGVRFLSQMLRVLTTFFTAVPMLIMSFIILNISYFGNLQMDRSIFYFALVLTLVGFPKLASSIEDSTRRIMQEDFIEGEVAIGKTRFQIARQNVLPHLIPTGVSLFFKEMGLALFLIAQLAVLYVFVGTTRGIKAMAFRANYEMLLEAEWGGMLSRISIDVARYSNVYWMTFFPVLTFSLAIVGLNLLGEGLRMEFQKRNSRVISSIRKTYFLVSPQIFLSQVKDFKNYYKPVLLKVGTVLALVLYMVLPKHPSLVPFDVEGARVHLAELSHARYEGRVAGTPGGRAAGDYIMETIAGYGYDVDVLEWSYYVPAKEGEAELLGDPARLRPLAPMMVETGTVVVTAADGTAVTYHLHEDFTILTVNQRALLASDGSAFHYKGIAATEEEASRVPEDTALFPMGYGTRFLESEISRPNIMNIPNARNREYDLEFVLTQGQDTHGNPRLHKAHVLVPFESLREALSGGYVEVEVTFDYPTLPVHGGRIIEALLPGEGFTKEDPGEIIIIGAAYDGAHLLGTPEAPFALAAAPPAIALEAARVLSALEEPLSKTIQFLFWDNEFDRRTSAAVNGSQHYNQVLRKPIQMTQSHNYYYFDIAYPGFLEERTLNVVTFPSQFGGSKYLVGMEMEKRLKQLNINYRRFQNLYSPSQDNPQSNVYNYTGRALLAMRLNALMSVGLGSPTTRGVHTALDTLENVNLERMQEIGQVLIDTFTMNEHMMEREERP